MSASHWLTLNTPLLRFSCYQGNEELDVILKQLQSELKASSTTTLLAAQLEALKQGWKGNMDEADLKALAQRFVLLHNIKPDTRSFKEFFHHGLLFALHAPPAQLGFVHMLVPFVQRASVDDLRYW